MGRSFLRMPPFDVVIFVCQTVSPTKASTLKGASLHKHGRKVNFGSGGSRFHAEGWPKPPEWTRHGTCACRRCPNVRDPRINTRSGPGANQHANEHAHQHAAVRSGLPTMEAKEAKRLEGAELDAEEAERLEDADWTRRTRSACRTRSWTRRTRSAWRTRSWTRRRRSAWRTWS